MPKKTKKATKVYRGPNPANATVSRKKGAATPTRRKPTRTSTGRKNSSYK